MKVKMLIAAIALVVVLGCAKSSEPVQPMAHGVLFGGVFAPIDNDTEAVQSIIKITDVSFLPGNLSKDATSCVVLVDLRGDATTERAYSEKMRMSCSLKDNQFIETLINADLFQDGENGVKGTFMPVKEDIKEMYPELTGSVKIDSGVTIDIMFKDLNITQGAIIENQELNLM